MGEKLKRTVQITTFVVFAFAFSVFVFLKAIDLLDWGAFGIGFGVSAGIVIVMRLRLWSDISTFTNELTTDANRLIKSASEMAAGNFNERLRTDSPNELGQIENALAQLSEAHKNLLKDIDTLKNTVSGFEKSAESTANIAKALSSGDYKASFSTGIKTETDNALEELRKKLETLNREFSDAQKAIEIAKKDAAVARDEAADAKREIVSVREENTKARSELSAANAEAAAAKRDAATARREADRLTAQLKPGTAVQRSTFTASKPATTVTPSATKLRSHDSAPPTALRTGKVVAPSGAHIYDSKDFGKF